MSVRPAGIALSALFAIVALLPAAAAAQGDFEGTVTMRLQQGHEMQYSMRGGKIRVDMSGQGRQMAMIMDPATHTAIMLMPAQQMYMQMPMHDMEGAIAEHREKYQLTRTGKSEVVAGHECAYWHVHEKGGDASDDADVCIASDLGKFFAFQNPMRRGAAPAWQSSLRDADGFPLKIVEVRDGQPVTTLEVTKIERKSLAPAMFEAPAGYRKMEMPNMGHE
ncbi:MAG TPA: DUF4412 domain-containing protein [Gemmatimonadaceae bacterium]